MGRKSENPRFKISSSIEVPSGGTEKNLNMAAQLQTIASISISDVLYEIVLSAETEVLLNIVCKAVM